MVVDSRRQQDESWVEYIRRATQDAENCASKHGLHDWIQQYTYRKWGFAGKVATGSEDKWSRKLLDLRPWFRTVPYRRVGRLVMRWADEMTSVAGDEWRTPAADKTLLGATAAWCSV